MSSTGNTISILGVHILHNPIPTFGTDPRRRDPALLDVVPIRRSRVADDGDVEQRLEDWVRVG
jgi:hypothetical protein